MLEQQFDDIRKSQERGGMECSIAIPVLLVHIGSLRDQPSGDLEVTIMGCPGEGGNSKLGVGLTHVGPCHQQLINLGFVLAADGFDQWRFRGYVCSFGILVCSHRTGNRDGHS